MYVSSANSARCNTSVNKVAPYLRGDFYSDLFALCPVSTEHSASNAENFVLNLKIFNTLHLEPLNDANV